MILQKRKKTAGHSQSPRLTENQHGEIRDFYRKILMMQEEEKRKISRDLHDETGQIVIALGAALNIVEAALKEGNIERALAVINENRKMVQEIAGRMKSMALNLRPPGLDILGLSAILREYFFQFTKSNTIRIEFDENVKDDKLNEDIEITIYRIIQEGIHNVKKHSMASAVKIDLIQTEKALQLVVVDNGKGFDVEEYHRQYDPSKMGLRGIKERVDILNGVFSVESSPGKGTKLTVILPLQGF